ncbi:hypothetical protein [Rhizobium lentis]|nr:hypothetical protein [Rhizobium lentis]
MVLEGTLIVNANGEAIIFSQITTPGDAVGRICPDAGQQKFRVSD